MRDHFSSHRLVTICGAALLMVAPAARAEYATIRGAPVTEGQMRIAEEDFERLDRRQPGSPDRLILKETRVDAEISGVLARVRVEQVFANPYDQRLEAVYVFPLPQDAAVDRYWFGIGEQVIKGVVKRREKARAEYEEARASGKKASLLEQERPDIFTQSVANIPPNETVTVHMEYVHPVQIDGSFYAFRFPMVVGPRYIPGRPADRPNAGRGWARDTDQVPDASRVTPHNLPEGMRWGNDVSIRVKLDAGMPIQEITGVTHELAVNKMSETEAEISLTSQTAIPNKDFVLEYRLAGSEPVLASLTHRGERGGYFALIVQPKHNVRVEEVTAREVILLLDTSGSMEGPGISQLRILGQHLLAALNPQDVFRIVEFNSTPRAFTPSAVGASPENIEAGKQFIRSLNARGGTEMLPGLQAALGAGIAEHTRPRYLILVTDALVGNDNSILGYLQSPAYRDVRVFPIAMGAAPNHYLISRAAEIGRGFAMQVTNQDNPAEIARRFNAACSAPTMADLEIDWGGLAVHDVVPVRLGDLYAGKSLVVMGRYDEPASAAVTLKGNVLGHAVQTSLQLDLPAADESHDAIATLWARKRIEHIWNRDLGQETKQGVEEITRLGLDHQLVTQYTSFVAIEENASDLFAGPLRQESVAVMLPEGMTDAGVGGAGQRVVTPQQPAVQPVVQPPPASTGSQPARRLVQVHTRQPSSGPRFGLPGAGSGGGGSVEWVFLAGLGILAGGRSLSNRKRSSSQGTSG